MTASSAFIGHAHHRSPERRLRNELRRLRWGYLVALATVAGMTLIGQWLVQRSLEAQQLDAEIINLAGRQRMLSQQMARFASDADAAHRTRLALDEWDAAHERLTSGDLSRFMLAAVAPRDLLQAAAELRGAVRGEPGGEVGDAADRYLAMMDAHVFAFAALSTESLASSRRLELTLAGVTILVLLLEAILIFAPLLRRVADAGRDLARAQKLLASTDAFRATIELAGSLAHDLNNFLQVIRLAAETLPEAPTDDDERRDIIESTEEARQLVKQLQSLADPVTSARETLTHSELEAALARLLKRMAPKNVELRFERVGDLPSLTVDRNALLRACLNVVANAGDALDGRPGRITVRSSLRMLEGTPLLEMAIHDDGPGMDPAMLERAVLPFVTSKVAGRGHGLGLAMVQQMVLAHGGVLTIDSERGNGTTVRIALPALREAAVAGALPARS